MDVIRSLPLIIDAGMPKIAALNTLREKLGEDGVNALFEVLEEEREKTRDLLFRLLEERFARRLAEEIGKLRSEMYEEMGKLRSEMHDEIGKLRAEMYRELAKVWNEIGKLRAEVQKVRSDIIKWMFVLAISQTVAIISVIVAIMRFLR